MPAYRTPEYEHLLEAERALAQAIKPKQNEAGETLYPEARDIASCATALVRVLDQKRILRGQGTPKPVEGRASKRQSRDSYGSWPGPACAPSVASDAPPAAAAPPPEAQS